MKKIIVIGSGFSSMAAACYLAKMGHEVHIFEKNSSIGGRARMFTEQGFSFDMGPSWYWMPDVFERFFNDFGKKTADYYQLHKLNPAYSVHFADGSSVEIADNLDDIIGTFEKIEKGAGAKLAQFIALAKENYGIAIKDLVYRPGISPLELVTWQTTQKLASFFRNISGDVKKMFSNEKLIQILEFPVLFLGAKPSNTPSFYNFMNYADFGLGTWYPEHGMHDIVRAMSTLARSLGVSISTHSPVEEICLENGVATGVKIKRATINADVVLSGADYAHTETLLPAEYRQYTESYWQSRVFAPSALLYYLGFNKKLKNIHHHMLMFDGDFNSHAHEIYDKPQWPGNPLFYANFTSVSDSKTAPDGMETGFLLMPIGHGVSDSAEMREKYFNLMIERLEKTTGQKLSEHIVYKKSYCTSDFVTDYNAYKGNAYGLANTLLQTAFLKPKLKSNKVKQLFFTGQLTVPGPGVPPALISGKLVAGLIDKSFSKN